MAILSRFLFFIGRMLLRLRYRIKLKGYDSLRKAMLNQSGSILFLPNHPAEIDPIILFTYLGTPFRPRPLVIEHFFFLKGVSFFMKMVKAVSIPNLAVSASKWKLRRTEKTINYILHEMDRGENFIIYPGGNLRTGDHEVIGGNSLTYKLLTEAKTIHPVLIRTSGLWGSRFSRALTGDLPDFWKTLFKDGLITLLKNGIFFAPRRNIEIEFSLPEEKEWKNLSRLQLNQYLEDWYNLYPGGKTEEDLYLVSSSRFTQNYPRVTKRGDPKLREKKSLSLEPEQKQGILQEVSTISGKPLSSLHEDIDLAVDLGLDSLDIAGLHAYLTENFDIPKTPPGSLRTVYDLFETAAGESDFEKIEQDPSLPRSKWKRGKRDSVSPPFGDTIMEAFLTCCDRMGNVDACGDEISGMISYPKVKLAALVLSRKFRALEGERIGILLPSTVGAYLCILATLLANKTPVMLNWTVGRRALEASAHLTELATIITSVRFLDRLESVDFGDAEEKFIFMEDVKKSISFKEKISGLWLAKKKAKALLRRLNLSSKNPHDPAVILFTSGTETLPKGVPLSHRNILTNQRDALSCVAIGNDDILLGALPPFHSFGFTLTGLFPLLSGLRVFYAPDPTDGNHLAHLIEKYSPTILTLAPTFYKYLFRLASKKQLESVRLMVTGAEKAPQEMFDYAKELGKKFIEGYGITECSPVVTLCREDDPPIGVGKPVANVQIRTIHSETLALQDPTVEGEICIKSPGVFAGYFGLPEKNPFIEIEGEKWYRSGDVGRLDDKGNLLLQGRLKRFVKIGGEMVSLGSVESALLEWAKTFAPEQEDKPLLAITAEEKEGEKTALICISTLPLEVDDMNKQLREKGFGQIVKIAKILHLDEIPLTGTGKVHYRRINEMIDA